MVSRCKVSGLNNDSLISQFRKALKLERWAWDNREEDQLIISLRDAEWFTPTFLAPVCVLYQNLTDAGIDVQIEEPPGVGQQIYLNQIGFPTGSKEPTEAYTNHLPLCLMDPQSGPDTIDVIYSKLREVLLQHLDSTPWSNMLNGVTYPISEIIDNVDYHSNCTYGATLVQNYPNKDFLDFCVVDDGISIPGSYDSHGISYGSDREAVLCAIQDGISTREDAEGLEGYGLRTTSDMVCEGLNGRILISSGEATLRRIQGKDPHPMTTPKAMDGTMFSARMRVPDQSSDFNFLDHIY